MAPVINLMAFDAAPAAGFPQMLKSVAVDSDARRRNTWAMSKPRLSSQIVSRTAAATSYYAYRHARAGPG